jgi:D-inositol-3-phosphate glycosyltransferase
MNGPGNDALPRRVALLSVHTSPLDQPGIGDAGGMNVYVLQTAEELLRRGVDVDVFTRATSSKVPTIQTIAPGLRVHHITAGPFEGLQKADLPGQLCAMTAGVLRTEAAHPEGWFDLIHSHYWLSGHVGWLAADRWNVPLVHSMHTMARVKNADLASGDTPEPQTRIIGEDQVVAVADRLIANTDDEAQQLIELYGADRDRIDIVHPGVELTTFTPGDRAAARRAEGWDTDEIVVLFVGRIQPLKAPDIALQAVHVLAQRGVNVRMVICGGPSGSGLEHPESLAELTATLGMQARVQFESPRVRAGLAQLYRAADITIVPSYSESFGLVAVESQACGTPVVAADVGGLRTAVASGGVLVKGHEPVDYANAIEQAIQPDRWRDLSAAAIAHAHTFSWSDTTAALLRSYETALARSSRLLSSSS